MTIASELLDIALETAADNDADTVDSMTIEVGAVTHVNPTQLAQVLDLMTDGTPAADAEIETAVVDPVAECECGWTGVPRTLDEFAGVTPDLTCPECGDSLTLTEGRGCRLASISVPDADSATSSIP